MLSRKIFVTNRNRRNDVNNSELISSCNTFTTLLGSGQKVISYSLYLPWRRDNTSHDARGHPSSNFAPRYTELIEELVKSVASLYPGWRMRIYHNVTDRNSGGDAKAASKELSNFFRPSLSIVPTLL